MGSQTKLTVDSPFTAPFGVSHETSAPSDYNYESCPSLTYENFDMRTENGFGVISSDGTNHVCDNVQYAKVTSELTTNTQAQAAFFVRHLKVGFTITMDGITRTVTKVVSNTLIHVDRAFKEGVQYTKHSYRYSVRKTGDFQDCVSNNPITQALAVEFDTWNNLKLHDPKQGVSRWWINATEFVGYNDNHVAIFSAESHIQSDHALNEHFAATPSIPNLADGQNQTVKTPTLQPNTQLPMTAIAARSATPPPATLLSSLMTRSAQYSRPPSLSGRHLLETPVLATTLTAIAVCLTRLATPTLASQLPRVASVPVVGPTMVTMSRSARSQLSQQGPRLPSTMRTRCWELPRTTKS